MEAGESLVNDIIEMDEWTLMPDEDDDVQVLNYYSKKKRRKGARKTSHSELTTVVENGDVSRKVFKRGPPLKVIPAPQVNYIVSVEPEPSGRDTLIKIVKISGPEEHQDRAETATKQVEDSDPAVIYVSESPPPSPQVSPQSAAPARSKRKTRGKKRKLKLATIPEQDAGSRSSDGRDADDDDDVMSVDCVEPQSKKQRQVGKFTQCQESGGRGDGDGPTRTVWKEVPVLDMSSTSSWQVKPTKDKRPAHNSTHSISKSTSEKGPLAPKLSVTAVPPGKSLLKTDMDTKPQKAVAIKPDFANNAESIAKTAVDRADDIQAKGLRTFSVDQPEIVAEGTGKRMKMMCVCPCGMMFSHRSGLSRHRRIVHLGMTYKCDFCGEHFTRSDSLNDHLRRMKHAVDVPIPIPNIPVPTSKRGTYKTFESNASSISATQPAIVERLAPKLGYDFKITTEKPVTKHEQTTKQSATMNNSVVRMPVVEVSADVAKCEQTTGLPTAGLPMAGLPTTGLTATALPTTGSQMVMLCALPASKSS